MDKYMQISFHRKRPNTLYHYNLAGSIIKVVNEVSDLGIILSSDLNFKRHIETIFAKAFGNLGFIKRNCTDMNYTCLKVLYLSLVHPVLEFGSLVWNLRQTGLIDKINKIQRHFIRMIAFKLNVCGLPIADVEKQYKISPLSNRRDYNDCLFLYKLLNGTIICPVLLSLIGIRAPPVNTRHNNLFNIAPSKRNFVIHSPINRILHYSNEHLSDFDFFFDNSCKIKKL